MKIIKVGNEDWELSGNYSIMITANDIKDLKKTFIENVGKEFDVAINDEYTRGRRMTDRESLYFHSQDSCSALNETLNETVTPFLVKTSEVNSKYKYFISFYAEKNDNVPLNDICEFDFDVLEDKKSLEKAEELLASEWFGDDRDIVIISIQEICQFNVENKQH